MREEKERIPEFEHFDLITLPTSVRNEANDRIASRVSYNLLRSNLTIDTFLSG